MRIDLHGYRPSEFVWNGLLIELVRQCWEMGEAELKLIHGHGRARGKKPGFYNTKTGVFGLAIRRVLRNKRKLRKWIKYTTLDCRDWGATTVKLKPNPAPSRTSLDPGLIEDRRERGKLDWHQEPTAADAANKGPPAKAAKTSAA